MSQSDLDESGPPISFDNHHANRRRKQVQVNKKRETRRRSLFEEEKVNSEASLSLSNSSDNDIDNNNSDKENHSEPPYSHKSKRSKVSSSSSKLNDNHSNSNNLSINLNHPDEINLDDTEPESSSNPSIRTSKHKSSNKKLRKLSSQQEQLEQIEIEPPYEEQKSEEEKEPLLDDDEEQEEDQEEEDEEEEKEEEKDDDEDLDEPKRKRKKSSSPKRSKPKNKNMKAKNNNHLNNALSEEEEEVPFNIPSSLRLARERIDRINKMNNSSNNSNFSSSEKGQGLSQSEGHKIKLIESIDNSRFSEAGIIKQLKCNNFMCHHKFVWNCNPNINIITGQNGSGKSAFIHALQFVFNLKASEIKRSKNLTELIMMGKDTGNVEVTLLNKGPEAFCHSVYGDEIHIKRSMKRGSPQTTFHIFNAQGKSMKHDKPTKILQEIINHFRIEIDNPIVIMSQEQSKKYLSSSTDKARYELFMKASMIEANKSLIARCFNNNLASQQNIKSSEAKLKEDLEELNKIKVKIDSHEGLKKLEQDIQKIDVEILWGQTERIRDAVDNLDFKTSKAKEALDATNERLSNEREKGAELQSKIKALLKRLEAAAEERNQISLQKSKHDQNLKSCNNRLLNGESRQKSIKSKISRFKQRLDQLKEECDKLQRDANKDNHEIIAQAENELNQTLSQSTEIDFLLQSLNQQDQIFKHRKQKAEEKINKYNYEIKQATSSESRSAAEYSAQKSSYESALQQENSNQNLTFFGANQPLLRSHIDRYPSFKVKPLGPIGSYLRLRDDFPKHLHTAAHSALGRISSRYLSSCLEDTHQIQNLAERANCKVEVHTLSIPRSRHNINIHSQIPDNDEMKLLINALDFNKTAALLENSNNNNNNSNRHGYSPEDIQNWLYNALVDLAFADTILLTNLKTNYEAKRIYDKHYAHGIRSVFLLNGSQVRKTGETYTDVGAFPTQFQFLLGLSGGIEFQKQRLQEVETKWKNSQNETRSIMERNQVLIRAEQQELKNIRSDSDALWKRMNELETEKSNLDGEKRRFQSIIETRRTLSSNDSAIQSYNDDIIRLTNELGEEQHKLEELDREREKFQEEYSQCEEKLKLVSDSLTQAVEQVVTLEAERDQISVKFMRHSELTSRIESELNKLNSEYETLCKTLELKQAALDEAIVASNSLSEAYQIPKPVYNNENKRPNDFQKVCESLFKKKKEVQAKLDEARKKNPHDLPKLQIEFNTKLIRFNNENEKLAKNRTNAESIAESLEKLNDSIQNMYDKATRESDAKFSMNLTRQGYRGELKFDKDEQTLKMFIQTDISQTTQTTMNDVSTLSGGEKSFAQLAFLMSLGEFIDSPFRCIDEFDVFMDSANRKMSMEMLFDLMLFSKHRQFFMLSPLDPTIYKEDVERDARKPVDQRQIAVHKMPAPRDQNQSVLNFQPQ